MSEHIIEIDDDSFENEVLQSPIPVLVDSWVRPLQSHCPHH